MNQEIALIVLPVFLVIGLGFVLKRTGLLNSDSLLSLNQLVYYIGLPALLFYKIGTTDFLGSFNGALLGGLVLTTLVIFGITYFYGMLRGFSPAVQGAFCQSAFRGNLAYIGLAIVHNAYGEAGFAIAGILLGFLVPLFNFLSVIALILPHRRSSITMTPLSLIKQVVYNPLIIAAFCGIVWSIWRLPIPQVVDRALHILTGMSLPLALLAIGGSFSFRKLQGDWGLSVLTVSIKLMIMPALAAVILILFGVGGVELAIGVLLAGTPTAAAAYIMAQQMKSDAELTGNIIMLSTLCSMLTYSFALYYLHSVTT